MHRIVFQEIFRYSPRVPRELLQEFPGNLSRNSQIFLPGNISCISPGILLEVSREFLQKSPRNTLGIAPEWFQFSSSLRRPSAIMHDYLQDFPGTFPRVFLKFPNKVPLVYLNEFKKKKNRNSSTSSSRILSELPPEILLKFLRIFSSNY